MKESGQAVKPCQAKSSAVPMCESTLSKELKAGVGTHFGKCSRRERPASNFSPASEGQVGVLCLFCKDKLAKGFKQEMNGHYLHCGATGLVA